MSGTGATLCHAPMMLRMNSGGGSAKQSFVICPKCEAPGAIRTSRVVTEMVSDLYVLCTNPGCGHTFKMQLSFEYSISPGNIDRPDLNLPVCSKDDVEHFLPPPRDGPDPDQVSMFEPPPEPSEAAPA